MWGYGSIDKLVAQDLNIDVTSLTNRFGVNLSEGVMGWYFTPKHTSLEFGHSLTKKEIKQIIKHDKKHIH